MNIEEESGRAADFGIARSFWVQPSTSRVLHVSQSTRLSLCGIDTDPITDLSEVCVNQEIPDMCLNCTRLVEADA